MKIIFNKNINTLKIGNKNGGFALLFTVVIVSAISVITAGLTNTIYKQMVLSSLVKDSSSAFYQADTAFDCGLYADLMKVLPEGSTFLTDKLSEPFLCGGQSLKKTLLDPMNPKGSYTLSSSLDEDDSSPCFNIEVKKEGDPMITTVRARGYNFCDIKNPRTVEREIQIEY